MDQLIQLNNLKNPKFVSLFSFFLVSGNPLMSFHFGFLACLRRFKFLVLLKYSNFCYGMFSNESFCFLSTLFVDLWLVDVGFIVWT